MSPFGRFGGFELRTTQVEAARAFYEALLGSTFWADPITVAELPAQAAARGAPAHWLGHLSVDDPERVAERIVALGGTQLGSARGARIILRDPLGAVVALTSESFTATDRIAWHLLQSEDDARAFAMYSAMFGWVAHERLALGGEGMHQLFAWREGSPSVGSITNQVRLPIVHPHWMYFFKVTDLDTTLAQAIALGSKALAVVQLENGDRLVAIDDPQGAAFGLYQRR